MKSTSLNHSNNNSNVIERLRKAGLSPAFVELKHNHCQMIAYVTLRDIIDCSANQAEFVMKLINSGLDSKLTIEFHQITDLQINISEEWVSFDDIHSSFDLSTLNKQLMQLH